MSATKTKKVHMEAYGENNKDKAETTEEESGSDDKGDAQTTQDEDSAAGQETEVDETQIDVILPANDRVTSTEQILEPPQPLSGAEDADESETTTEAKLALPRQFSSEYFLHKHTPSFKCFEQYLCSQSDIRVALYFFPPLPDPKLDDAINYIPPKEEADPNGADKYIKMCKDLSIVPIKRVINSLNTDTLNLKYYGLTLKQMRGIASALKVNINIKYFILEDNWMSPEATSLISDILRESNSIRVLNLRECRISEEGAEKLCEGLALTQFLQELDLSYNSLGDKGLKILLPSLCENVSIRKLNISHNGLTEDSAETLEIILIENKGLQHLDLSWSGFFTGPGNKKLCNGLSQNDQITWLSLAWNGIATGAAMRPITKFLRKAEVLEFLDLSWNSITGDSLRLLRRALNRNKSLKGVMVGNNIFTPDEAYSLASTFMKAKHELIYLDMENMCVQKDFLALKRQIKRQGKTVVHGYVLSNYQIKGPNINKLLFERCRFLAMKAKKKKLKIDFGHFVLSLPDKPIPSQDFETLAKKKKLKKIDKDLLHEVMSRFMVKNQRVDCVALKEAYMQLYPDTVLPEEKKKKKKGKKKRKNKKQQAGKDGTTDETTGETTGTTTEPTTENDQPTNTDEE